jgi:ADP-heptose:LPS heptosyltransferase
MYSRIAILKPCCIGDVIFSTPLLAALRRAYPVASIDWFVGSSAIGAIRNHPDLNQVVDTGPRANPASRPADLLKLVRSLRSGHYDLLVVPDRSPLFSIAALLSGIPHRAGLDSARRGFGYNIKVPIDPHEVRHEADIYLDVARALHIPIDGCWVNVPPTEVLDEVKTTLEKLGVSNLLDQRFVIVHPGGGVNAGMTMIQKRWPADHFAALADRIVNATGAKIVVIGAKSDQASIEAFKSALQHPMIDLSNQLSLAATGALASLSMLYIGNDNGLAHLAAASGAKVLMIFGPSDPRRYGPFVPPDQGQAVWRHFELPAQGIAAGIPLDFDWLRDGATVDDAWLAAQSLPNLR